MLLRKRNEQQRRAKEAYEADMERLEREAWVALVKMEREEAKRRIEVLLALFWCVCNAEDGHGAQTQDRRREEISGSTSRCCLRWRNRGVDDAFTE